MKKYSTVWNTGVIGGKSAHSYQSSQEYYTRNWPPQLFATRTLKQNKGNDNK